MSRMCLIELARQATRFCKAPNSVTVEEIEKLTEKHVARTRKELSAGDTIKERDQADVMALEKLTRKIGILSLLPATQRTDLCRRVNLLKFREEKEALFEQGDECVDYYIPIVGAFECVGEHHTECLDMVSGSYYPKAVVRRLVGAGKDMYFEQGVGMPHQQGVAHKEGSTSRAICTAWPRLHEPTEGKKTGKLRMSISERRAAKRPGGLCIVLAIPMQDVIDTLLVQENEIQNRAMSMQAAFDFFKLWEFEDLCAVSYQLEHHRFEAGEDIVKPHAAHNGKFYLVIKGRVDLNWVEYDPHDHARDQKVQMTVDERSPYFGEHLLCGDSNDTLGMAPDYIATVNPLAGCCEVLIGMASAIRPFLNQPIQSRFLDSYEERRSRWFQIKPQKEKEGLKRHEQEHLRIMTSSPEEAIEPENMSKANVFSRFAPKEQTSSTILPSKLKYTEKILQNGDNADASKYRLRVDVTSPAPAGQFPLSTKKLASTRILVRPDLEGHWSMGLSSPYSGRMTFTAPSRFFGETDRQRESQIPAKLPTLLDSSTFTQVCLSRTFLCACSALSL